MSTRASLGWPRFAVEDVHRFISMLTGVFIVIHGGSLLLDQVVPFSLRQELVPFTSSYRPFGVALGIVSAELLGAIAMTNALRGGSRTASGGEFTTRRSSSGSARPVIRCWSAPIAHDPWLLGLCAAAVTAVGLALAPRLARVTAPAGTA